MKHIFKGLSLAVACACLLAGTVGCHSGEKDLRREKFLRERKQGEERLTVESEESEGEYGEEEPDIDPGFSVAPEREISSEIPL